MNYSWAFKVQVHFEHNRFECLSTWSSALMLNLALGRRTLYLRIERGNTWRRDMRFETPSFNLKLQLRPVTWRSRARAERSGWMPTSGWTFSPEVGCKVFKLMVKKVNVKWTTLYFNIQREWWPSTSTFKWKIDRQVEPRNLKLNVDRSGETHKPWISLENVKIEHIK